MGDKIRLQGMQFYAYHGGNPEERSLGQPFVVDLEVELDLRRAGQSDDLDDTVSYTHLYRVVREVMESQPRHLLEAVAEEIARRVLAEHPPVQQVEVRVTKVRPPIKGAVVAGATIEIERRREG